MRDHAGERPAEWLRSRLFILASSYLDAFRLAGLYVTDCREPLFADETVADLPAAAYIAEANRAAFVGTPALIIWDVRKPGEQQ